MSIFDKIKSLFGQKNYVIRNDYSNLIEVTESKEFLALFSSIDNEVVQYFVEGLREYLHPENVHYYHTKFSYLSAFKESNKWEKSRLIEFLISAYQMEFICRKKIPDFVDHRVKNYFSLLYTGFFRKVRKNLSRKDLTRIVELVNQIQVNRKQNEHNYYGDLKLNLVFGSIKLLAEKDNAEQVPLKELAKKILFEPRGYISPEERKYILELGQFLSSSNSDGIQDGATIFEEIIPTERRKWVELSQKNTDWKGLLVHLDNSFKSSKPSASWLKQSKELLSKLPANELGQSYDLLIEGFVNTLKRISRLSSRELIDLNGPGFVGRSAAAPLDIFRNDRFFPFFKSFVHTIPYLEDKSLSGRLLELFFHSTKKISGVGAVSKVISSATIYAAAYLPKEEAIMLLIGMERKTNYPSVRSIIQTQIQKIATKENVSIEEIRDRFVPEFAVSAEKQIEVEGSEYKAQLAYEKGKLNLSWLTPQGKSQKSVPKVLKDEHPKELKRVKQLYKDIAEYLISLKTNLEEQYLKKKSWDPSDWKERYIDNPVLSMLGRRLIWRFEKGDNVVDAFCLSEEIIDVEGNTVDVSGFERVLLWHPIFAQEQAVSAWREFLFEHRITQPIKQAHREVYVVTDAERTTEVYSNRFASHILRQHIFLALCKTRMWRYTIMGAWDSHNIPSKRIPSYNMMVEYFVEGVEGDSGPTGTFNYIVSDQVRFYDNRENDAMRQADVPAIVFSEIMRDVDMFVAVSSIGADPNWQDRGNEVHATYWNRVAFGELTSSAEERKALLERLVPMLKIRDQCTIAGKFLIVKGKLYTYKIHLGSGNIQRSPNDQYLCIVASSKNKSHNIFLPFEGDRVLSIILSKAFMLAEDDKITDKTILSQLNR